MHFSPSIPRRIPLKATQFPVGSLLRHDMEVTFEDGANLLRHEANFHKIEQMVRSL